MPYTKLPKGRGTKSTASMQMPKSMHMKVMKGMPKTMKVNMGKLGKHK